jgi:ABC-type nitrate/sulfonate/bicarbonate transport system substrate-binding protein
VAYSRARLGVLGLLVVAALALTAPARAERPARTMVHVLVPDGDNLQYLAFWVAQGAGLFAEEGIDAQVFSPEIPAQAIAKILGGEAQVAVLPPPVYLQLIADRFPIELVANLLQNDPINLVVRRSVFDAHNMSATAPLHDRLLSLKGLRIGVAPGPPTRLRALFTSEGLDADDTVKIVVRHGKDQNDAFANDQCDALYAHTPYVEKALDDQDAVVLVNQSGGDAPPLAMRQIHALVATREYLGAHEAVVESMVRAIARAERLIHADRAAAEDAVMRALPSLERRHVHTIVGLYQPAVPDTPRVSTDGLAPALALFPASRKAPSLEGVPLADFVAPGVLEAAMAPPGTVKPAAKSPVSRLKLVLEALGAFVLVLGLGITLGRRRRKATAP